MLRSIAYCGLNCATCPGLHAASRLTMDERRQVAEKWNLEEGASLVAEDIDCAGCTATEGTLIRYCAVCPIRLCARERGLTSCIDCPDRGCENVSVVWTRAPEARSNLEAARAL